MPDVPQALAGPLLADTGALEPVSGADIEQRRRSPVDSAVYGSGVMKAVYVLH